MATEPKHGLEVEAGETKKRQAVLNSMTSTYRNPNDDRILVSGSQAEKKGKIEGLQLGKVGYGQDLGQSGDDVQRIKELSQARTDQSAADPVTAAIMNQKAGAIANAQRQMAASGVKGGAAAGAVDEIARKHDADIAASLYGQQRQSLADERSLIGNILSGQTSLMYGSAAKGASNNMPQAPQSGGLGTVICTELWRQEIMPDGIYIADCAYSDKLPLNVRVGYVSMFSPIIPLMQKSPMFTKFVSFFAMSWARHIAEEKKSIFGYLCQKIGEPICGFIGSIIIKFSGDKYGIV